MQFSLYPLPITPSDVSSDHDSLYHSPRPQTHVDPVSALVSSSARAKRTHATLGVCSDTLGQDCWKDPNHLQRRRAQNRAAQRAFCERKEKHVRGLEAQSTVLNDKYSKLEVSHSKLNAAYEKLRKTIELLTKDDDGEGESDEGRSVSRQSSNPDTLRKLLESLHGDFRGVTPVRTRGY